MSDDERSPVGDEPPRAGGRARSLLLLASLVVLLAGVPAVLVLFPGRWWLLCLPVAGWGGLFMAWAALLLKNPRYYG